MKQKTIGNNNGIKTIILGTINILLGITIIITTITTKKIYLSFIATIFIIIGIHILKKWETLKIKITKNNIIIETKNYKNIEQKKIKLQEIKGIGYQEIINQEKQKTQIITIMLKNGEQQELIKKTNNNPLNFINIKKTSLKLSKKLNMPLEAIGIAQKPPK